MADWSLEFQPIKKAVEEKHLRPLGFNSHDLLDCRILSCRLWTRRLVRVVGSLGFALEFEVSLGGL